MEFTTLLATFLSCIFLKYDNHEFPVLNFKRPSTSITLIYKTKRCCAQQASVDLRGLLSPPPIKKYVFKKSRIKVFNSLKIGKHDSLLEYFYGSLEPFLPHKEPLYTSNIYPMRRFHKAVGIKKV